MRKKKLDAAQKAADQLGVSKSELYRGLVEVWEDACHTAEIPMRELALSCKCGDKVNSALKFSRASALVIQIAEMLPFIKSGYTEKQFYQLRETELGSVLGNRYDDGEQLAEAAKIVVSMCKDGEL